MEKRAERLQTEEKKKRKPTKTRREPASQNVKPIHCFPEALTRQNVETQPSLEGFCSPVGLVHGTLQ